MALLDDLDTTWIEKAMIKRKSNYSPVICFETSDPKRLHQLKEQFSKRLEAQEFEYVFVYDKWDGLGRLVRSASGAVVEPYKKAGAASALVQRAIRDSGVEIGQIKQALKEVDPFLKEHKTAFIIQNISENREWESGLQSALRAWAIDQSVMMRGSVVFVVTNSATPLLDDYTRDLVVIISIDPSLEHERKALISRLAKELSIDVGPSIGELVLATSGLNLHQLESVLLESYYRQKSFHLATVKELKSDLVKKSGVLEVKEPMYSFRDIGGYDVLKDFIRKYVINVLGQPERARKFALPLPKGILFFGPPGTGKSLFANALASEIQLPFINLVTENIYSKWLGESGQRMKNAITLAEKMSPAIVFVDEIDRFGRRTGLVTDSAGEETKRVFSQFLEWLGDPNRDAIIVGTTNVPEHLDEAFTRTGRFDYKVPFLYPGREARLDVLKVHLGLKPGSRRLKPPLMVAEEDLVEFLAKEVVPRTKAFSCAELEELVTRAKRVAFDRGGDSLSPNDFLVAVKSFRINLKERLLATERYLNQARRFTDDQSFLDGIEAELDEELREGET